MDANNQSIVGYKKNDNTENRRGRHRCFKRKNIAKFKIFSNYLKQKNTILPIVNSGQAPSSLFINNYIRGYYG